MASAMTSAWPASALTSRRSVPAVVAQPGITRASGRPSRASASFFRVPLATPVKQMALSQSLRMLWAVSWFSWCAQRLLVDMTSPPSRVDEQGLGRGSGPRQHAAGDGRGRSALAARGLAGRLPLRGGLARLARVVVLGGGDDR